MKIEKSGDRPGATQRITISFSASTYEALRAKSEKEPGYSIAGVARQVIGRAMAAGLLYAETPSSKVEDLLKMYQSERLAEVYEELRLAMQENIDLLLKEIALKDQLIAEKQQRCEKYAETITEQASAIEVMQNALRVLDGTFVVRDVRP